MKVFYDGDCYFCTHYAEFAKLRSQVGDVELISLRSRHPEIESVRQRGFRVNRGFVIEHDGIWLEGDKAFSYLNLLMRGNGFAQRFLMGIAKRPAVSAVFYRFLVFGRYAVLALQGLTLIDLDGESRPSRYRAIARLTRLSLLLSLPLLIVSMMSHFAAGDRWAGLYTALVLILLSVFYLWGIQRHDHIEGLLKNLSSGGWRPFLVLLIAFLFAVNAGTPIGMRRFLGLLLSAPVWGLLAWYGWRAFQRSHSKNWLVWLPAAAFLFAAIPGFIIGPFYGGIVGWVIQVDETQPIKVSGYKLVNAQGQSHWLGHAFFQPHGQIGRFQRAYRAMPGGTEEAFVRFTFETYKRAFPGIVAGRFPHQWALGDYAYPTHSLQKYDTETLARDFAPENVVAIKRVREFYDHAAELIEVQELRRYHVEDLVTDRTGR